MHLARVISHHRDSKGRASPCVRLEKSWSTALTCCALCKRFATSHWRKAVQMCVRALWVLYDPWKRLKKKDMTEGGSQWVKGATWLEWPQWVQWFHESPPTPQGFLGWGELSLISGWTPALSHEQSGKKGAQHEGWWRFACVCGHRLGRDFCPIISRQLKHYSKASCCHIA